MIQEAVDRNSIVIWTETPLNNLKLIFEELAKIWEARIVCIVFNDLREERKQVGWSKAINGIELIELFHEKDILASAKEYLLQYISCIHVFTSYTYRPGQVLKEYRKLHGKHGILISERPSPAKNPVKYVAKQIFGKIYYSYICKRFYNNIAIVLATGMKGVKVYESFGWKRKVYDFMYINESISTVHENELPRYNAVNPDCIKLLYVGRLNYRTRGFDILIKALNNVKSNNWTLDVFGGYGEDKDEIIAWANNNPHVRYCGVLRSIDTCKIMENYDVYLNASKIDGWCAQINEAIISGMAVICSDEAVSDEMVKASQGGLIIRSGNIEEYTKAIEMVLQNPSIINEFKKNSIKYRERILPGKIGYYLKCVLCYAIYKQNIKPECPWL